MTNPHLLDALSDEEIERLTIDALEAIAELEIKFKQIVSRDLEAPSTPGKFWQVGGKDERPN